MDLPKQKSTRLKGYDYSIPGEYFITICVKDRKELFPEIIVGTGFLDCPQNILIPNFGNKVMEYSKVSKMEVDKTVAWDSSDIILDKYDKI